MPAMRLFALGLAALVSLSAPASAGDARALLRAALALEDADWREADAGGVAVRVLDTPHRREIAAVALMSVRADRATFLAVASDPAAVQATNPDVTAAGPLGRPAHPSDLAGVVVDERNVATLAACRAGTCAIKLDDDALDRLAREVDWRSPTAPDRAAAILRERLASLATDYAQRGVVALPTVHDRAVPVDNAARARELLMRAPRLGDLAPELARFLENYPRAEPGIVRDALFWSREAFWRRQVLSLGHLAAHVPDGAGPVEAVVAMRQLDANHYFEAALTVTAFVASADRRYVARLYRFETDHKGGGFNFLERALIRRSARKRLERQMNALRALVERPQRGPAAP
jgi:hypothetical protein